MLKGKLKAEILNEPTDDDFIQPLGSTVCYDVYVNIIDGVPFAYFVIYNYIVYEYDGSTGVTTELTPSFSDEPIFYIGANIQNNNELSKLDRFSITTNTWIEPLTELTTPTTN